MGFRLVNRLIKTSDNVITNNIINKVLTILLIIYIIFIVPNMLNYSTKCANNIVLLFNNVVFRLLIYLLIGYIAQSNTQLSIFMTIALIVTFNTISKYEFKQNLLDILIKDQINKKELEIKKNKIIKESSNQVKETSIQSNQTKETPIKSLNNFETYNNDNINNFSYLE